MGIKLIRKSNEAAADIYTKAVKKAFPKWPQKAINLVSSWYENEDAADDYPTIASLAAHIADDLPNMLDSADNAEYIKQVMADTDGGDLYTKVKAALKKVFPNRRYSVDDADSYTVGVTYSGKNKIPNAEFRAGLKKLAELLPTVNVVDYGGFGENSIGFEIVDESKVRESKKNEANSFDFKGVEEDSKAFDFQNLIYRLTLFRTWLEDLHDEVGAFPDPTLLNGAAGTSGYKYTIHSGVRDPIQFDIDCGTNPERYPEFEGAIYAGSERFEIKSRKDLTAALIKKIAAAYKKGAEKGVDKGADK